MKRDYTFWGLTVASIAMAMGTVRLGMSSNPIWPLGLNLLGLFLVAQLLEKESALLAEQCRSATPGHGKPVWRTESSQNSRNEVATHPVPTMARAS